MDANGFGAQFLWSTVLSREKSGRKGERAWTWGRAWGQGSQSKGQIQDVKGEFYPLVHSNYKVNNGGDLSHSFVVFYYRLRRKLERNKKWRPFKLPNKSQKGRRMLRDGIDSFTLKDWTSHFVKLILSCKDPRKWGGLFCARNSTFVYKINRKAGLGSKLKWEILWSKFLLLVWPCYKLFTAGQDLYKCMWRSD